jgi:hypothetical protein
MTGDASRHPGKSPLRSTRGLDGRRIPGGCDDCEAYQTVCTSQAPTYRITVHHDDTCAWLNQRKDAAS